MSSIKSRIADKTFMLSESIGYSIELTEVMGVTGQNGVGTGGKTYMHRTVKIQRLSTIITGQYCVSRSFCSWDDNLDKAKSLYESITKDNVEGITKKWRKEDDY